LDFHIGPGIAVAAPIKKKQPVTIKGYGQLTLKSVHETSRINPSKAGANTAYTYLYPKKNKTMLLDVQVTLKNLKSTAYAHNQFLGVMSVINKKPYFGYVYAENDRHTNISKSAAAIGPGKTRLLHAVMEIPKGAKHRTVQIYLYFNGAYYQYTWK